MTTRQERKAAQEAKIAAMPGSKRMVMVLLGGLTAFAAGVAMNYLLSGEPRLGIAIAVALGITVVMAYQYLVAPSRR